jgi:hypothetical protein
MYCLLAQITTSTVTLCSRGTSSWLLTTIVAGARSLARTRSWDHGFSARLHYDQVTSRR